MSEFTIEGALSLGGSLPVYGGVLDAGPVTLALGDFDLQVVPPRHPPAGTMLGGEILPPRWLHPEAAQVTQEVSSLADPGEPWGSLAEREPLIYWITKVKVGLSGSLLPSPVMGTSPSLAPSVRLRIEQWRDDLVLWLEALTEHAMRRKPGRILLDSLDFWDAEGPINGGAKGTVRLGGVSVDPVSADNWSRVLNAAASGPPPVAWELIVDAQYLLASGDYRRSVIDSATAADIALSASMEELIRACPDNFQKLIKTRVLGKGLGTVAGAHQELGAQFWKEERLSKLKKARDLAAHDGVPPSESEAADAMKVARGIVRHVLPMEGILRGVP